MIINSADVPSITTTIYPEPFKSLVAGREKQKLGDMSGLKNFGVNLVKLKPGSCSALRHWHTKQDEFVYVLVGNVTLVTNAGEQILKPHMAVGFPAGEENGHQLVNRTNSDVVYLEIGDRTPDDQVTYPDDDLMAKFTLNGWVLTRKDGTPYSS